MSYMRSGSPLRRFKGTSESYVFSNGEYITDYGDEYKDKASFCELIARVVMRETNDAEWTAKVTRRLAEIAGIKKLLLNNGYEEDFNKNMKRRLCGMKEDQQKIETLFGKKVKK